MTDFVPIPMIPLTDRSRSTTTSKRQSTSRCLIWYKDCKSRCRSDQDIGSLWLVYCDLCRIMKECGIACDVYVRFYFMRRYDTTTMTAMLCNIYIQEGRFYATEGIVTNCILYAILFCNCIGMIIVCHSKQIWFLNGLFRLVVVLWWLYIIKCSYTASHHASEVVLTCCE